MKIVKKYIFFHFQQIHTVPLIDPKYYLSHLIHTNLHFCYFTRILKSFDLRILCLQTAFSLGSRFKG